MDFQGGQNSRPAVMVLYDPELLERVLQHLSGHQKTLVSASLTAKAFSEPAFNVLWYEMYSLWPLFRILPTFERGVNEKYLFTGPIRNEHLQRVLYYAKRIRSLDYKDFNNDSYSMASRELITSTIMRVDKLGAFIPLRKIHLHKPLCNTMLFPFTSPNLDDIKIVTDRLPESTEMELASFLQSVASQSPLLKSLYIQGLFRDITLQVLPDFVNLHSLTMLLYTPDIPPHFLRPFASSMPSLRELTITSVGHVFSPRKYRPPRQPDSIFQTSFPSLEKLVVLVGGDPIHLENFFSGFDAPLLMSTALVLMQTTSSHSACLHKLVKRNRQLQKEKVHTLVIRTVDPPLTLVKSFKNLRELVVSPSRGAISMSDFVDTFNSDRSWSRFLMKLTLNQTKPFDGMSIAALHLIADACPNLKSLEISIHLPEKPEKPTVRKDGEEHQSHGLEQLVFSNLPAVWDDTISLAVEFVSLLDHLFPSMAVPKYIGGEADKAAGALATHEAWWKGVEDMWKMCQTSKVRKISTNLCRCSH